MAALNERSWQLVVAPHTTDPALENLETGLDVSALAIRFNVRKTLKPKPNTATIEIFGLSADSRQYLHSTKTLDVRLLAGYNGQNEQIFLGQTRFAWTRQEGPERVSVLETGTSEKDMAAAHVTATYGAQMTIQTAFQAIQASLPVAPLFPLTSKSKAAAFIIHPVEGAVDRHAARILTDYCRSAGLEWSIQDESLLILTQGQPLNGQIIEINEDTGMVESPSVNHLGELKVKCLLQPGLHPGAQIHVTSESFKGAFRIEGVHYQGSTAPGEKDWFANISGMIST